jgi:hypothetical protein
MSNNSKLGDYWNTIKDIGYNFKQRIFYNPPSKQEVVKIVTETKVVMFDEGRIFIRLAGLSGALAVVLAAYGTHGMFFFAYLNDVTVAYAFYLIFYVV